MASIPRPGTPYPDMPSPTYRSSVLPARQRAYSSTPIHFTLPTLPARTPPSLLARTSSGSSSRSARTPSTPALIAPVARRESSVSVCSSLPSPIMPSTPVLEGPAGLPEPSPEFLLPESDFHPSPKSSGLALPPPVNNWTWKEDVDTQIFNGATSVERPAWIIPPKAQRRPSTLEEVQPKRPKLQRRPTPRPRTTTLHNLAHIESPAYEGRRRLTSVVDGNHWVILETL